MINKLDINTGINQTFFIDKKLLIPANILDILDSPVKIKTVKFTLKTIYLL